MACTWPTGRAGRVEAAQIEVQLAVREIVGDPMRPVHSQRGFPDPRSTSYSGNDYDAGGPSSFLLELVQNRQGG